MSLFPQVCVPPGLYVTPNPSPYPDPNLNPECKVTVWLSLWTFLLLHQVFCREHVYVPSGLYVTLTLTPIPTLSPYPPHPPSPTSRAAPSASLPAQLFLASDLDPAPSRLVTSTRTISDVEMGLGKRHLKIRKLKYNREKQKENKRSIIILARGKEWVWIDPIIDYTSDSKYQNEILDFFWVPWLII